MIQPCSRSVSDSCLLIVSQPSSKGPEIRTLFHAEVSPPPDFKLVSLQNVKRSLAIKHRDQRLALFWPTVIAQLAAYAYGYWRAQFI